jgi:hypothetical protein
MSSAVPIRVQRAGCEHREPGRAPTRCPVGLSGSAVTGRDRRRPARAPRSRGRAARRAHRGPRRGSRKASSGARPGAHRGAGVWRARRCPGGGVPLPARPRRDGAGRSSGRRNMVAQVNLEAPGRFIHRSAHAGGRDAGADGPEGRSRPSRRVGSWLGEFSSRSAPHASRAPRPDRARCTSEALREPVRAATEQPRDVLRGRKALGSR